MQQHSKITELAEFGKTSEVQLARYHSENKETFYLRHRDAIAQDANNVEGI
jgi:hypothetical protein